MAEKVLYANRKIKKHLYLERLKAQTSNKISYYFYATTRIAQSVRYVSQVGRVDMREENRIFSQISVHIFTSKLYRLNKMGSSIPLINKIIGVHILIATMHDFFSMLCAI